MFTPFAFIQPTVLTPLAPPTALQYILLGGAFTLYNSPSLGGIAKIDSTGSLDSFFNMGTGFNSNSAPYFITQQPDGKYLVGGFNIALYSGSAVNRIVRINQNGTQDTTFNIGTGFNNSPNGAAASSDNSSVMVGNFTTYSGSTVNSIVGLNASGARNPSFNTGFGLNQSAINDVIQQPDGKYIVIGNFTQYSSSNNYISRTNISSSYSAGPGSGFNTGVGFNGQVNTMVTQSDGKILVGGGFTTYSGSSSINNIVRLNIDGARDTTFNTGTGFNTTVFDIKLQSDGKLICVGNFTSYSGSAGINRIARLNTNGTLDTSYNTGTGFEGTGLSIAVQSDDKALIAASNTYSGSTVNRIVRINTNGTRDTTFNTGTGFNGAVNKIILQSDGKAICGGNFTTYSGSSSNTTRIIRLNTDGTQDTTLVTGTGYGGAVFGLALEPSSNKIVVAGNFTTYQGSTTNNTRLNRLFSNGNQDTSFVTGTGTGVQGTFSTPTHLSVESDGKIYLGAFFSTYSGSTTNRFARINPSGTLDTSIQYQNPAATGFDNAVRTILITGSNIYYGGDFTAYRATPNIVRINPNGTQDNTFAMGSGFQSGAPTSILAQTDGKILVGGPALTPYSGSTTNGNLTRLNPSGSLDSSFSVGTGPNGVVITMATESSGKIVLAGGFTAYSGVSSNRIIRITNSGSRDASFNIGTGLDAYSSTAGQGNLIVLPDNSVYVTGTFTSYSGSSNANKIVKIQPSGAIDTTFVTATSSFNNTALGFNGNTIPIIQSGSSIIVGGFFTTFKNPTVNRGIMTSPSGAISSSFNIGAQGFDSTVRTWATQSDGKIIAGGSFTTYGGSSSPYIVRINPNGTRDTTFNVGTGFNSSVFDIRIQSDGKVIALGQFTTYSGSSTSAIVRLNTNGTRDTTFNVGTGFTLSNQSNHGVIQSDGKIVVIGLFTTYSGSTSNRIVRINSDGTRDTTYDVGTGFNQSMESIIIQPDQKVVTNGNFTTYSGSSVNRIIRLNTNGTYDTTFNTGNGLNLSGYSLALQSDNKIICAFQGTSFSGSTQRFMVRINPNGTADTTFTSVANLSLSAGSSTPNSLAVGNDGKIYWGNTFDVFSGSFTPNRIVRLNPNGSVDESFNQQFPNIINNSGKGANGTVFAVLLL